jgi:hypothetical protein
MFVVGWQKTAFDSPRPSVPVKTLASAKQSQDEVK